LGNIEHSERDDAAQRVAEALWPQRYVGDVTTAEWERCYAVVDAANEQLRGAVKAIDAAQDVILDALAWMGPEDGKRIMETANYKAFKAHLQQRRQ
jgi:hypothetical protein